MRKHLKIATEDVALELTGTSHQEYGHDRAPVHGVQVKEHGKGPDHSTYGHDRAPTHGMEVKEHGQGPDHSSYGHDRAPMHGAEVHEIEAEHVTLEDALAALEQQCLAIEEAHDVVDSMVELGSLVDQAPLNTQSRKIVAVAMESLLGQVGDSSPLDIALEAEAGTASGPSVGEQITSKARKIWQAIIAAIKRAIVWFKAFCRRLFDQTPKLKKRAEALQAQLKEPKGERSVEKMNSAQLAHELVVEGKVDAEAIVKGANTASTVLEPYFRRLLASELYSADFLKQVDEGNVAYDPVKRREIFKLVSSGLVGEFAKATGGREYEGETWSSEEMPGGLTIACQLESAELKNVEQAIRKHTLSPALSYTKTPSKSELSKLTEHVGVGTPAQLEAALRSVLQLLALVEEFRKVQDKLENLADKCVAMASELERKWGQSQQKGREGETDADGKTRPHNALIAAQRFYFAATPRMFVKEPADVVSYALRTSAHLCSWVEASLKLYKPAAKAE